MRQIGSLDNEIDARRFGAYLLTQGVKSSVEDSGGGDGAWSVWVEDDDHLARGRAELDAFRPNRADPRYDAAVGEAEKVRKALEQAEQRRRKQFVDVRTRWGQPSQFAKPVTVAMAAISIVIAFATQMGEFGRATDALFIAPFGADGTWSELEGLSAIRHGQVWRLVTPIFIHSGILHLLFNMLWLVDLGSMVETRKGSLFLLAFVLITAVVSNLAEYYWPPLDPGFGGMSGVVYGLFGYVWINGRYRPHLGMGLSKETAIMMLAWLVICAVGIIPNIANVAHVAGLVCGVVAAYVPYGIKRLRRGR